MTARYAVILTRIRAESRRDERSRPESLICRCEFEEWDSALRTARQWAATPPVRTGRERVKTLRFR
ncbi:MAG: hypothetical protein ACRDTM_08415 [Micromonosporaceae bacterium]